MIQTLSLIALCIGAAASAWSAWDARRRYKWFQQSLRFRSSALQHADAILNEKEAPEKAKQAAALLRALATSPKTLRKISELSGVLKSNPGTPDVFEGIPSRYVEPVRKGIGQLAVAALLDDPKHAPGLSKVLDAKFKPRAKKAKEEEVSAISSIVYAQIRNLSAPKDSNHRLVHC